MSSPFAQTIAPELLRRARRREAEAVAELYRRFAGPVFNLARRLGCDRDDAEEVLQEVFVALMASLPRYQEGPAPFWAWLRAIAVHRALDRLRQHRHLSLDELEADHGALAEPPVDALLPLDLSRALERLRPAPRAVLWLHLVEGYSHREIAESFGRSESFSKSALARALAELRALGFHGTSPRGDEHAQA